MKSSQIANIILFVVTVGAGIACLALGHEQIGSGILLAALGHAAPSPMIRTSWGAPEAPPAEDTQ